MASDPLDLLSRCSQCGMRVIGVLVMPGYTLKGVRYPAQQLPLGECFICYQEIIEVKVAELSELFGIPQHHSP